MEYGSEKCETCFAGSACVFTHWENIVTYYLVYKWIYGNLNACMAVLYDF